MPERPTREKTDIRLVSAMIMIAVAGIAIGLAVVGARIWFGRELQQWERRNSASYSLTTDKLPAEPRLEPLESHSPSTRGTFAAAEREKEAMLHRYGRTEEDGYVHIPIEKAMERAAKDLQASQRSNAPERKSRGLVTGGEANSGRVLAEGSP